MWYWLALQSKYGTADNQYDACSLCFILDIYSILPSLPRSNSSPHSRTYIRYTVTKCMYGLFCCSRVSVSNPHSTQWHSQMVYKPSPWKHRPCTMSDKPPKVGIIFGSLAHCTRSLNARVIWVSYDLVYNQSLPKLDTVRCTCSCEVLES